MLERKTTKPDELQKLTLALRDFERRLKRRRPEHLKAELQKHKDERKRQQLVRARKKEVQGCFLKCTFRKSKK